MMRTAPRSLRLHIGIFGRTNVGKSSFLNMVTGQDVAITSAVPGTTTDVVEKTMELLPVGPVVFLDTAGTNDNSLLGRQRLERTAGMFGRCDVALIVAEPDIWGPEEEDIVRSARAHDCAVGVIINKADLRPPGRAFIEQITARFPCIVASSTAVDAGERERVVGELKRFLKSTAEHPWRQQAGLLGDLVSAGGLVVMVVPIDLQAPRGRLILPQVQAIRDALDNDAAALIVKEREYASMLAGLKRPPDLALSDSQAVLKMIADTPATVKCTTFSILFSRFNGDLIDAVRGVRALERLEPGAKILIAEACSHHAIEDDIGRVKIPRWIRQYAGCDLSVDVSSGCDFPSDVSQYALIVHCGACMFTRKQMQQRVACARQAGVPMTNYGVCIAYLQGALERVLSPFPLALEELESAATPG